MILHLPKQVKKRDYKQKQKAMRKCMDTTEMTKGLHEKFQAERGAMAAFCREKGITHEWLRLVFIGEYEDLDLMIEAADFLAKFKAQRQASRQQKAQLLNEKVQALTVN